MDGEIVLNPTQEQRKVSDLALTVAATMDKIVMIEAGANEVDEDTMLNAIKAAHVEIKKIITFINGIVAERGKPKIDFQVVGLDMDVFHAIQNKYLDDFKAAMDTDDKNVRDAALLPIMDKIAEEYPDLSDADLDLVSYKMQKYVVRRWLLDEGKRVDGRGINEIRPLAAEVGILPRVHGSGMFTRGQTQVLTTCTLGGTKDNQLMDDLTDEQTKRYIHHYNFPPYSVGEARAPLQPRPPRDRPRRTGRARSGSRAAFSGGVPLHHPLRVGGPELQRLHLSGFHLRLYAVSDGCRCAHQGPCCRISCGLVTEGDRWITMTDIQGVEDFLGDMDFKVAGTHKGITAIQMDIKIDGLTYDIIAEAFEKCRKGRLYILDEIIKPVIAQPREELSRWAPKMFSMMIPTDKIKDVIGKGGKVIQDICATCNCKDRRAGGRPCVRLCCGSGGRKARHLYHQDHCRGPRDRCHLQGQGDPPDELWRLCGDRPGQGRPCAHLQAGHQARGARRGCGRRGRCHRGQGHGHRPAGPHQPEPPRCHSGAGSQARRAGAAVIHKSEGPHSRLAAGSLFAIRKNFWVSS